jgi:DNA-binding XRE family transcriptional regulator
MEYRSIKNKELDRRVKLSDLQKEEILKLKSKVTQISLAKAYGVSRRTIQFIWFPEQLEENKKRRAERGGSKQYYEREKHNLAMKEHRAYKRELTKKGLI